MTIRLADTLTGISLESILFLVLVRRRAFFSLPVFTLYIAVSFCTDSAALVVHSFFPHYFISICIVNVFVDFAFFMALIVELGRNVLRFNQVTAPNRLLAGILFVTASLILSMLSRWPVAPHLSLAWQIVLHAVQGTVILEFAAFLALVWWTGLMHLRWPVRELRIATGFGFYTLIALAAAIVHTHQSIDRIYRQIDWFVVTCYLGVLAYWSSFFIFADRVALENQTGQRRAPEVALGDNQDPSWNFALRRTEQDTGSGLS